MKLYCKICGFDKHHDATISYRDSVSKQGSIGVNLDPLRGNLSRTNQNDMNVTFNGERCNFCLNFGVDLFLIDEPQRITIPPFPDLILSYNLQTMLSSSQIPMKDFLEKVTVSTKQLRNALKKFRDAGINECKCNAIGISLKVRIMDITISMKLAIDNYQNEVKYRIIYGTGKIRCPN